MYRVYWMRSARTRLADAWVDADSRTRAEITAAAAKLDRVLKSHPLDCGESRGPDELNERIFVVDLLVARFRVDTEKNEVTVMTVHVYRKRSSQ
jgi:hypothetical protein